MGFVAFDHHRGSWCKRSRVFYWGNWRWAFYWFHEWGFNRYCWGIHLYNKSYVLHSSRCLVLDLGPIEFTLWMEDMDCIPGWREKVTPNANY